MLVQERFTQGGVNDDGIAGEASSGCRCRWWWPKGERMSSRWSRGGLWGNEKRLLPLVKKKL